MENRPIVGITMGDPAGTGPEISIKALADPAQYEFCRPLIIGDADIMEQAKGFVGHPEIKIHRCEKVRMHFFSREPWTCCICRSLRM